MRRICLCISVLILFFPVPFLFGFGFKSIRHKRNTGGSGVVNQTFQDDFQKCFATVTYASITKNITVPCQSGNATGLPIAVCYNRHSIDDFAYADHEIHGDGYYTSNPYNFCATLGYRVAKNMVLAGYILSGMCFFMILIMLFIALTKKPLAPRPRETDLAFRNHGIASTTV